jgi:hypothetical protein
MQRNVQDSDVIAAECRCMIASVALLVAVRMELRCV